MPNDYNWRNVLKHEGSIDPRTIEHAKRMIAEDEKTTCELYKICPRYKQENCTHFFRNRCELVDHNYHD